MSDAADDAQDNIERRWATQAEQVNNVKRNIKITIDGKTKTLSEWCAIKGISYWKAYSRIRKLGWSPEEALND